MAGSQRKYIRPIFVATLYWCNEYEKEAERLMLPVLVDILSKLRTKKVFIVFFLIEFVYLPSTNYSIHSYHKNIVFTKSNLSVS